MHNDQEAQATITALSAPGSRITKTVPEIEIRAGLLLRIFAGVLKASSASEDEKPVDENELKGWLSEFMQDDSASVPPTAEAIKMEERGRPLRAKVWQQQLAEEFKNDQRNLDFMNLVLAVAILRQASRKDPDILTSAILEYVWPFVYAALTNPSLGTFAASRSAQGFLYVPLYSILTANGDIDELIRFHVWLPAKNRGLPEFAIHSHQPWAQSWILAGRGTDHAFKTEPAEDSSSEPEGIHAVYSVRWKGKQQGDDKKAISEQNQIEAAGEKEIVGVGAAIKAADKAEEQTLGGEHQTAGDNESNREYKTHQHSSTAWNTGTHVRARKMREEIHTRDMSYIIPSSVYHYTKVDLDQHHATLFYFDSSRGFDADAGTLGPTNTKSSTQYRDPAGVTPAMLATIAAAMRASETAQDRGRSDEEFKAALRAYHDALNIQDSNEDGRGDVSPDAKQDHLKAVSLRATESLYNKAKEILSSQRYPSILPLS
ncbi:hypothetical protein C8Q79DRAFT_1014112 [Trametes meyenii]|nr:hypothetical protein C8Q79DRAFT_1014112 [Trametes meyenii]